MSEIVLRSLLGLSWQCAVRFTPFSQCYALSNPPFRCTHEFAAACEPLHFLPVTHWLKLTQLQCYAARRCGVAPSGIRLGREDANRLGFYASCPTSASCSITVRVPSVRDLTRSSGSRSQWLLPSSLYGTGHRTLILIFYLSYCAFMDMDIYKHNVVPRSSGESDPKLYHVK